MDLGIKYSITLSMIDINENTVSLILVSFSGKFNFSNLRKLLLSNHHTFVTVPLIVTPRVPRSVAAVTSNLSSSFFSLKTSTVPTETTATFEPLGFMHTLVIPRNMRLFTYVFAALALQALAVVAIPGRLSSKTCAANCDQEGEEQCVYTYIRTCTDGCWVFNWNYPQRC